MIEHLKHMAEVRPEGLDRDAAVWALAEIEKLRARNERLQDVLDEIARLRTALIDARDGLRNDFEPDNQSRVWHRANDALKING